MKHNKIIHCNIGLVRLVTLWCAYIDIRANNSIMKLETLNKTREVSQEGKNRALENADNKLPHFESFRWLFFF